MQRTKTPRSHMSFALFQNIAETLFPFAYEVELNSRGEPLLYPQIDKVFEAFRTHQCAYRVQHNGTLLNDRVVEQLTDNYGVVSLSIDAVSPLFEQVRRHGSWEKVEAGLKNLAAKRDPARTLMTFYPTITERTVCEMLPIVRWAHEHGVDAVVFHDYNPITGSIESLPDQNLKKAQLEAITNFLQKEGSDLRVQTDSYIVHMGNMPTRAPHPSPIKGKHKLLYLNYPTDPEHRASHPRILCPAVWQSINIGLEGLVTPCCRTNDLPFGRADSVEAFTQTWLGPQFTLMRRLLQRSDGKVRLPMQTCLDCTEYYAPQTAKRSTCVPYEKNVSDDPDAMVWTEDEISPLILYRTSAQSPAYLTYIPLGVNIDEYVLYEDDKSLGPYTNDKERVMTEGRGLYTRDKNNAILVSASDNSDIPINGRRYVLKKKS